MKTSGFWEDLSEGDNRKIVAILKNYFREEPATQKQYENAFVNLAKIYVNSRKRPEMEAIDPPEFGSMSLKNILVSSPQEIEMPRVKGKVLIKPNLVHWGEYPETTSTDLLEIVVERVLDMGSQAAIGDGPSLFFDSEGSLGKIRYLEKRYGIRILNMNSEDMCRLNVKTPLECETIDVFSRIMDFDYLVNLSQIKGHKNVGYSCVLKNLFGMVAEHERLIAHRKGPEGLKRTIADVYNTLKPSFNLVDARKLLVCAQQRIYGGYEIEGPGILAGSDAVEMDRRAFAIYCGKVSKIKEWETYLKYV